MSGVDVEASFTWLGDSALVVGTPHARALLDELRARPLPGVQEVVPALHLLTLLFDPLQSDGATLEAGVRARLLALRQPDPADGAARTLVVPVRFGGPGGPDLGWCAARAGLDAAAFVQALCRTPLEVAFLGFTPGFAFLTGLPPELRMPRLDAPRERVPAGSVALGGPWAGVYPRGTPGGWRIVGVTDLNLFDLSRPEPVPWRAGDRVRLEAVAGRPGQGRP
ncbi:allophanate hydrolase subunit 1 [Deinococcus depolymerans]|uniref:Carboxyltransferase domain-containing protein n=1 Tax=Deinococcus depolymerans TaxID=392408 RepID=A0ABN1BWN3_9DEIO